MGRRQRVVAITGGGGGIGAAIAEELGRRGTFVVTMDPMVTLDGAAQLPAPEETTAGRIIAAGGAARSTSVSVTDRDAVVRLFGELAAEFGGLDGVINVAGITRPTAFASGSEEDWRDVLAVHLDGYRNVLDAALPLMAEAGYGRIVGVTSGSGWRRADAGAYSCAKRAVAALTWQLGRVAPHGVAVNAISPIAVTRMVTAALGRAKPSGGGSSSKTGGLSLGSMPSPEALGPIGAHLVDDDFGWCRGQVLFTGGSELALIAEPELLEVVQTEGARSLAHLFDAVVPGAFAPAESSQASAGGSNPRFSSVFAEGDRGQAVSGSHCAVAIDDTDTAKATIAALEARDVRCTTISGAAGFEDLTALLADVAERSGPIDAVVVGPSSATGASAGSPWARVLAEHEGVGTGILTDAAWARACVDQAAATGRPIRLVNLVDASNAGGRSRAQAAAQLSRAAPDGVGAFAVSLEADPVAERAVVAELAAHLAVHPEAVGVAGAEFVVAPGRVGLRSHPRPRTSVTLADASVPAWFDDVLGSGVGGANPEEAR